MRRLNYLFIYFKRKEKKNQKENMIRIYIYSCNMYFTYLTISVHRKGSHIVLFGRLEKSLEEASQSLVSWENRNSCLGTKTLEIAKRKWEEHEKGLDWWYADAASCQPASPAAERSSWPRQSPQSQSTDWYWMIHYNMLSILWSIYVPDKAFINMLG